MYLHTRFVGIGSLRGHRRVAVALAGICLVAMAIGVTPTWSIGQMVGGAMSVLAFSSVIALATAGREEKSGAVIAGRISAKAMPERRAA